MALRIDKLRFRNILVRGGVAEPPAVGFSDALDDTFREQLEGVATERGVQDTIDSAVVEIKADAAEREVRITRQQLVLIGMVAGGFMALVAIGMAILLAVL